MILNKKTACDSCVAAQSKCEFVLRAKLADVADLPAPISKELVKTECMMGIDKVDVEKKEFFPLAFEHGKMKVNLASNMYNKGIGVKSKVKLNVGIFR